MDSFKKKIEETLPRIELQNLQYIAKNVQMFTNVECILYLCMVFGAWCMVHGASRTSYLLLETSKNITKSFQMELKLFENI